MRKYNLQPETDELYNRAVYKFPNRTVMSSRPNQYWSVDLVDMSKKPDGEYKYILNMVDVFSRKLMSVPMKTKKGHELQHALEQSFYRMGTPSKMWIDKEGGMISKDTQEFLKGKGVETYHTYGRGKSAVVEALQRTQKMSIEQQTKGKREWMRWIKPFQDKYNGTTHSTTGHTPNSVYDGEHQGDVFMRYKNKDMQAHPTYREFEVGQDVRLQIKKEKFEKGYTQRWTTEVFTISKKLNTNPITYNVKDKNGSEVKGAFYAQELQKV